MHHYLANFFSSEQELDEHLLYGGNSLGSREDFIIGLYGMTSERTMLKGQGELAHLYSAITQCVNNWTENFKKNDSEFRNLWSEEEWKLLLTYEQSFISTYPRLTNWKREPPKAPKLFELESYQQHRNSTIELFEQLVKTNSSQQTMMAHGPS